MSISISKPTTTYISFIVTGYQLLMHDICFNIEISMQKSAYLLVSATARLNAGQETIQMPLKHSNIFLKLTQFIKWMFLSPVWHFFGMPDPVYIILTCYVVILDIFHHLISFMPDFFQCTICTTITTAVITFQCTICTTITTAVITFQLKSTYICPCNLQTQRTSYHPELKCICWFMLFTVKNDLVSTKTYRCQGRIKLHTMSAITRIHRDSKKCTKLQFFNTATKNKQVYVELPVP
jgi:hypothetical protein